MALGKLSGQSQSSKTRVWKRILLPLFLWLLLVLVLYGIQTQLRWMGKTRLGFTVTLQGQSVYGAAATIDGKPVISGQKIALGSHTFSVKHPRGETYSTNFYIHYGGLDLGTIDLKRATGTLSLAVDPPAGVLVIRGPEWLVTLTNSSGLTNTLPTDVYEIEVEYPHWHTKYEANVFADQMMPFNITPHFGGLQLDCNQSDATFRLQSADGQVVSEGMFPLTVTGLPAGDYLLHAWHHGHDQTRSMTVTANTTTDEQCDFQYGAAVIETAPSGAVVLTDNGRNLGETPLTLIEIPLGDQRFILQRSGYQSVQVSLNVTANQTNFVSTNLVSETYLHALTEARQYMANADYEHALHAAGDALTARPDDVAATALQNEASGLGHLQRAKVLGHTNDYVGGNTELALALQALPDNEEIKELIVSYRQREPAQIERERAERSARPKKVFDEFSTKTKDAELFEGHELTTTKPVKDVVSAIMTALERVQPIFKAKSTSPESETYVIYANQSDANIITTTGWRQCLIVCGQARDDETQIYFKVMEYKAKHNVAMQGLLGIRDDLEFIPIHPSKIPEMTDKLKAQVQAGVSNLTVRIQGAVGPPKVQRTVLQ